jgi:pimeloyl-ACP methyl ester carboxylesterase
MSRIDLDLFPGPAPRGEGAVASPRAGAHAPGPPAPLAPQAVADRPCVIALHSSASGPRQWEPWRALVPEAVELVAPALIGYGDEGGGWSAASPVTLAEEALRLAPWLERRPGGVHLLGHSYGGAVALELALRWPARVRSLTLYEPVRFGLLQAPGARSLRAEALELGHAVAALVRGQRLHAAAERFVDYWSGPGAWAACGGRRRAGIAQAMPKVAEEFGALFADQVPAHAWSRLAMPVRLLAGSASPAPVQRIAELLAQVCPRSTLQRLEGLGHMGPVQAPAQVAAAVEFRRMGQPSTGAAAARAA